MDVKKRKRNDQDSNVPAKKLLSSKPVEVKDEKPSKKSRHSKADISADIAKSAAKFSKIKSEQLQDSDEDELEIDVDAPEPLSRKELRRAKKGKPVQAPDAKTKKDADDDDDLLGETNTQVEPSTAAPRPRSEYGIWIGNLPFSATKDSLRTFLNDKASIAGTQITRLQLPTPAPGAPGRNKAQNKGFAYIDFDTPETLATALKLTESLLGGRKVLIKSANNYEGRPDKSAAGAVNADGTPNIAAPQKVGKRVFVGNLAFDNTKKDLEDHFEQAGEVANVFLATFEDSGKCKGYGWVTFHKDEAANNAVRGYIFKEENNDSESESESDDEEQDVVSDNVSDADSDKVVTKTRPTKTTAAKKKQKKQKWFINRLNGRELRCEIAEDPTTRYNKRYKNKPKDDQEVAEGEVVDSQKPVQARVSDQSGGKSADKDQRQAQRRQKHIDARNVKPGAALANAPRNSGAIVQSAGRKTTFD